MGVLRNFSDDQADAIYTSKYGFNSIEKMIPWVIATDGSKEDKEETRTFLLK